MAVASIVSFFTWSREKNGSAPTVKRLARSIARIMSRCIFGQAGLFDTFFLPSIKRGLPPADKRLPATRLVDAVIGSIIVTDPRGATVACDRCRWTPRTTKNQNPWQLLA